MAVLDQIIKSRPTAAQKNDHVETQQIPTTKGKKIFHRILGMLINEAADTLYHGVASAQDIDLAMTKGVNYPKGLLRWADEWGIKNVVNEMNSLKNFYEEDRYRISPQLKKMLEKNEKFF